MLRRSTFVAVVGIRSLTAVGCKVGRLSLDLTDECLSDSSDCWSPAHRHGRIAWDVSVGCYGQLSTESDKL